MHLARGAIEEAEQELEAGTVAQDLQQQESRFGASGLHFLLGLVRLARGEEAAAFQEFERELALEDAPLIYTREVCAHTWCALGALRLRQKDSAAALAAFDRALAIVAGYPLALTAGLAVRRVTAGSSSGRGVRIPRGTEARIERRQEPEGVAPEDEGAGLAARLEHLRAQGTSVEAAIVEAIGEALAGRHAAAASLVHAALQDGPAGSSGWMLAVDPFLNVAAHPAEWEPVLALLRSRAA